MIDLRISRYILLYSILIVTRLGLDAVWNTFSNVCHHIHMSNLVWKHLHCSMSFRSESRMISNDWYTSFLRSVGILDYDRLAISQKRLVILTTILLFSIIPCFVYHSVLTKAKPKGVKSQTNKDHYMIPSICSEICWFSRYYNKQ